jgi:hypothetical protein
MVAPLVVVGAVGYVAFHAGVALWFMSKATSPLSADARKEFLDEISKEIDTIEKLKMAPEAKIASLRFDVESLRSTVEEGWQEPHLYAVASRLSTYRAWMHTKTGVVGTWNLFCNTLQDAIDTAFPPSPHSDQPIGAKAEAEEPPQPQEGLSGKV